MKKGMTIVFKFIIFSIIFFASCCPLYADEESNDTIKANFFIKEIKGFADLRFNMSADEATKVLKDHLERDGWCHTQMIDGTKNTFSDSVTMCNIHWSGIDLMYSPDDKLCDIILRMDEDTFNTVIDIINRIYGDPTYDFYSIYGYYMWSSKAGYQITAMRPNNDNKKWRVRYSSPLFFKMMKEEISKF